MPAEPLRVHKRRRLRTREVESLDAEMKRAWGITPFPPESAVESGSFDKQDVIILKGRIVAFRDGGTLLPTVHLILSMHPRTKFVTVDMGAVKFVCNGADVMAPGVVEAEASIQEGEGVWIRDMKNGAPLAVGKALAAGPSMRGSKGKVVRTLHFVGDRLWGYEP
ncbi:MAG: RNA-binding protein [Euryarchaeota archaeon]|nr:RNA-binding protein [Euryarchaeota archaeon]